MVRSIIVSFLFIVGAVSIAYAQPSNADCTNPISINNPSNYCSAVGEFTNVNAGPSGYGAASCWDGVSNDVWFQFTAQAQTASITVIGSNSGGGTLQSPQIALYIDNGCTGVIQELRCASDVAGDDIVSLTRGNLTVGESYYIRVDGRNSDQGTFELCVTNFNPPTEPGQDCATASILCNKDPFVVEFVTGAGNDTTEADGSCFSGESSSTWFKWTCMTAGTLTFVLDPIRKTTVGGQGSAGDDLDFGLYELPLGIDACTKSIIRCNATHPFNYINGQAVVNCNYETGLDLTSTETEEDAGCDAGEDGFVRFIDMQVGVSYALVVNNFSDSGQGFEISFGGTGEFLGPEPLFTVEPMTGLRCDTDFMVNDFSTFSNGSIVEWEWSFGVGAVPAFFTGQNPPPINYETFGDKSILLTVTSDKGCVVTERLDFFVDSCCEDIISDLGATIEGATLQCAEDEDGTLVVQGTNGFPPYMYSIDGGDFTNINSASGLGVGIYDVIVQDGKGCEFSIETEITAPEPLIVDAGEDVTVDLGVSTQLDASFTPVMGNEIIEWIVNAGLDCTDCLDPNALAPGTTTYVIQVTDENGCERQDEVTVSTFIERDRPIFAPNIMLSGSSTDDGRFFVGTGPAAAEIERIQIYDRWGNLIWEGTGMVPNEFQQGWDGKFNGEFVNPAVFAWVAYVRYLDDVVIIYNGDVTVVR